jgi:FkbM family methyltransferase
MLTKFVSILKNMGVKKALQATINSLYLYFCRDILKRTFLIKRIHCYRMKLPIDKKKKGIAKGLLLFGVREEDQLLVLKDEVQPGMVVLDLGANIGYYTLLLESLVGPQGKVYAYEPSSDNINILKENIKLNNKEDVIDVFHAGVSDKVGSETLYLSEQSNVHNFITSYRSKMKDNSAEDDVEEVDMFDIDTLIKNKRPINFIRMDTEGYEVKVFRGMKSFVKQTNHEIKILFEVHRSRYDDREFNMNKELTWLFQSGFVPKVLIAKPLLKDKPWGLYPFSERGYRPDFMIKTDGFERGYYTNISNEDVLDYVCSVGCVRALFLCRAQKPLREE